MVSIESCYYLPDKVEKYCSPSICKARGGNVPGRNWEASLKRVFKVM